MTLQSKLTPAQRDGFLRLADKLVIGLALALPWSTSAAVILICLWVVAILLAIEPKDLIDEVKRPASYLPIALFVLAAIGMLWADVSMKERLKGVDSYLKLLTIPLFMIHFRRSDRAIWALGAFLLSGSLLLLASGVLLLSPHSAGWGLAKGYGVPVKDYISQSAIFTICAFGLFYLSIDAFRLRWRWFGLLFFLLGFLFLADMFFVVTSRTALFTIPFLILLLGFRQFGWKGTAAAFMTTIVAAAALWLLSENVRTRVSNVMYEIQRQQTENAPTSSGLRLDFWKRSIESIIEAPVIGHGTGSIREAFQKTAVGQGASAVVPVNPHNQTFAVAIQLGLVGAALLFAMWIAHFMLFFGGGGMASWLGLLVVVQNVLGSLANSHLFDFTHGWLYCIGVGICGGIATRQGAPLSIFLPTYKVAAAKP